MIIKKKRLVMFGVGRKTEFSHRNGISRKEHHDTELIGYRFACAQALA